MPRASGTASALALPMAIGGSIGYLHAAAPAGCTGCTGYVYLPAVAAIGVATVLTVPLGARLTSVLPTALAQRLFAMLLVAGAGGLIHKKLPDMVAEAEQLLAYTPLRLATAPAPAAIPAWLAPSPGGESAARPELRRDMPVDMTAVRRSSMVATQLIAARLPEWLWPAQPLGHADAALPPPATKSPVRSPRRVHGPAPHGRGTIRSARPRPDWRPQETPPAEMPAAGLLQTLFGR
jgi:hypothetical protein